MNRTLLQGTFRRFAGKMILNNLVVFCGAVVNGVAISRYLGTDTMAAFQLTLPLFFAVMMFSQIVSIGVQNNCAKSLGAGRAEEAGEYYSLAVLLCLPLSLLFALPVFFWAEELASLLGAAGPAAALLPDAADYLRGFSLGIPMLFFIPMQIAVLFLEGRAKWALRAVFAQTAVNVLGAICNLFVLEGGIFGMGLAMSLSYFVSLAVMCGSFIREKGCIAFSARGLRPGRLLPVFRVGLPSAVDRLYKTIQMFVVNKVLLLVAPGTAIAAFADINALNNVFNPVVMGLSSATLTMAGVFTGERDRESLKGLLQVAGKNALLLAGAVALAAFLAAPLLMEIFVPEGGEAYGAAVHALRIYIWYLPLYALNNVLQKYCLGVNAMRMTYIASALDNLVFICLLSVLLGNLLGEDGVWLAFILAEVLTTSALFALIAWQKGGLPGRWEDVLFLPKDLATEEQRTFAGSAASMEEVVAVSEEARLFLLDAGASGREATLMALAVEEMGGNIIRWGFGDGGKHSIDVAIVKGEGWFLRIRDDCRPFNPKEWLELHRKDDPARNIGIRAICSAAEDVRYSRMLGLNYLLVRL